MDEKYEQLTLDLQYHPYDHYTVELRKGAVGAMENVRSHVAKSVDEATNLIESLRDYAAGRDDVTWQHEEVDSQGVLYGLVSGPDGATVYMIAVVPPLQVPLSA